MSKLIPAHIPPQPSAAFSAAVREARDNSIGYLVTQAQRLMHRGLGERLQQHGVSVAQWTVLVMLWEVDGLTQRELSERVAVDTATLSRTLDRMERDGLAVRKRSAADRRQVHIHLTGRGAGLWRELVPEAETMLERALEGFSANEEEALRGLLKKLITNVRNCSCQRTPDSEEA